MRPALAAVATLLVALFASVPADAQRRIVPESATQTRLSYAPVVKRTAPAVVNVFVTRRARQFRSPFAGDPMFDRFFGRGFGVPRERMQNSLGSGVIVAAEGIVVTNYHVIKGRGEAEIRVVLTDKREFDAEVMLTDEKTDLAVLRLRARGERFPFLRFENSDELEVGDLVLAIGNPFGVGQTVTSGIISAKARTAVGRSSEQFFLQTDAAVNPGNSGGALVDMNGRLVGINTAIFSRSGGSNGIGFAIPANLVRVVVNSAMRGGRVERPWLGARLSKMDRDKAAALGLDRTVGVFVEQVYRTGPARDAGLREQDVIISVNGREVADPRAFNYRFTTLGVGGEASLVIMRNGRRISRRVALQTVPGGDEINTFVLRGQHPFSGASIAEITPALAEQLRLKDLEGVVVIEVPRRSYAGSLGLRQGDVILQIGDDDITNRRDLERALRQSRRLWRIAIERGGRTIKFVVQG